MDTQSTPAAHPLRPYYVPPPPNEATFAFGGDNSMQAVPASSSSAARYSPRIASLRVPGTSQGPGTTVSVNLDPDAPPAGMMLRAFVTSSVLSFAGTALVMPFDVGKTLAQVQWVPKDGLDPELWIGMEDAIEEEAIELDDEGDAEAYFSDIQAGSFGHFSPTHGEAALRPVSPSGYITRSGVSDALRGTKPEWVLPVVVQGGVWDMIKTVGRWKGEGWSSLWKGQLTTCLFEAGVTAVQPIVLAALSVSFLPSSAFLGSTLPIIYAPRPGPLLLLSTISHLITTVLFSPLDLIRCRLIVQSAQPQHRKYTGPFDAFRTILREEGGLWTTYFHPNLLFPAIVEGIVRPLVTIASPLIISRYLHVEPSTSPISFCFAELVVSSVGLLITIPIETVRRRLQIQSRAEFVRGGRAGGTGRPWRTCVETRPIAYLGMVEAVYRILTEETGRIPRRRRLSTRSASRDRAEKKSKEEVKEDLKAHGLGAGNGLRQLYRGLGMGFGANVVVCVLGLIGGTSESSGWAEM